MNIKPCFSSLSLRLTTKQGRLALIPNNFTVFCLVLFVCSVSLSDIVSFSQLVYSERVSGLDLGLLENDTKENLNSFGVFFGKLLSLTHIPPP